MYVLSHTVDLSLCLLTFHRPMGRDNGRPEYRLCERKCAMSHLTSAPALRGSKHPHQCEPAASHLFPSSPVRLWLTGRSPELLPLACAFVAALAFLSRGINAPFSG